MLSIALFWLLFCLFWFNRNSKTKPLFQIGAAWLRMVRRGSVGSASACCKAGPSSILVSAPQGGSPTEQTSDEEMVRGLSEWRRIKCDCMNVSMCVIKNMKNKTKEWHHATKHLIVSDSAETCFGSSFGCFETKL